MIQLSRSHLSTLTRCERKFQYRYVQGLPDVSGTSASEGTLLHAALAAAYRYAQANGTTLPPEAYYGAGVDAIETMLRAGVSDYRGTEQALAIAPDDDETRERLLDVFAFYMHHSFAASLAGATIVAVEEPYEVALVDGTVLSGVFDLVLRRGDVVEVWDHKSVGDVNGALRFLALDVQMLTYEVLGNAVHANAAIGTTVEMVYNLIRRERPPGFGTRPLRTKSGALSKASTNPADYLRQHRFDHPPAELQEIRTELAAIAVSAAAFLANPDAYAPRRPIKTGGESCLNSCPYFALCGAELVGHGMPSFVPALAGAEEDAA